MSLQDEITKAIGAHGMWKARLKAAIDSGNSEFRPDQVCVDNLCDFGRWLYGSTIAPAEKAGQHYRVVLKCHAEFHKLAAEALGRALAGKKAEASMLINPGSRFANLSVELTTAMMAWAKSAEAVRPRE